MNFEEYRETTMEKLLQTTFGLWNALLTVNGIMLTVFSALYAISPQYGTCSVRLLIVCCVISVCLLVLNHVGMKYTYYRMGEVIAKGGEGLSPQQKERDLKVANTWHRVVRFAEGAALFLFVVEVVSILIFTFSLR